MKNTALLFLILSFNLFSQSHPDSLYPYGESTDNDSLKAEALLLQCINSIFSEPGPAKARAKEALRLSRKAEEYDLEARSLNALGIAYDITGKGDSAMLCYEQCLALAERHNLEIVEAQALNNMGLIYWNRGERDLAIEKYVRSLEIFEKNGKDKGVANNLNNIGLIYAEKHDYKRALNFHKRALVIRKKIDDQYGIGASLSNIAQTYTELGSTDSSRAALHLSNFYKERVNDQRGLGINHNVLGVSYLENGQADSAGIYIKKAIALFKAVGDKKDEAANHRTMAKVHLAMGNYPVAQAQLDTARRLASELGAKRLLLGIMERQLELDTLTGNYRAAASSFMEFLSLKKDLDNVERDKAINEIQTRYETEKKERELAENKAALALEQVKVKQRTNWVLAALAIALLILVSAIYIYRQQRMKQIRLREEAKLKEQLAHAELQNRIQEERVRISRDLHDHVGAQLTIITSALDNLAFKEADDARKRKFEDVSDQARETISQLRETIWAMNSEEIDLRALVAKLREFTTRLETGGQVEIFEDLAKNYSLGPTAAINLYRLCQEAISNALKYAAFEKLSLRFVSKEGLLQVWIKDDGKGFDPAASNGKGNGLANMRERAKTLGGDFSICSAPGKGTEIKLIFPLEYGKLRIASA